MTSIFAQFAATAAAERGGPVLVAGDVATLTRRSDVTGRTCTYTCTLVREWKSGMGGGEERGWTAEGHNWIVCPVGSEHERHERLTHAERVAVVEARA